MKIAAIVIVAILVGVAVGIGAATLRMRQSVWDGDRLAAAIRMPPPQAPAGRAAEAAVDHEEYDFGSMDPTEERRHEFVFTNRGTAPLKLTAGATSCRCTLASLDTTDIPPGKSGKVTLTWKAKDVIGEYRQTAQIATNDPQRPVVMLTVKGDIVPLLRSDPATLIFSRLAIGEPARAEVRVWCSAAAPPLKIVGFDFSDGTLAKYFDVKHRPLTAAEIAGKKAVTSGALLEVAVRVGLPQGAFQQTIVLHTNLQGDATLALPVQGTVGSDVGLAGPGWDVEHGMLNLGTVNGRAGAERRLLLIVRGPHGRETRFKVARVDPDFLQVELGKTTAIGGGAAVQTPLIVRIPQGSRPVSRLGTEEGKLGEIILETTHPLVPRVRILIRFAVEG